MRHQRDDVDLGSDPAQLDDRHDWASSPALLAGVRTRARTLRGRPRTRMAFTCLAVVALVGTGLTVGLDHHARAQRDRLVPGAPAPTGLVAASGAVVAVPGRPVRFCAPLDIATAANAGPPPPPAYCDYGVDVDGVDLSALTDRRDQEGAVGGRAKLVGTYRDGVLHVRQQAAPDPWPGLHLADQHAPCPEPAAGWQTKEVNPDIEPLLTYQAEHLGQIDHISLLRPDPGRAVPGQALFVVLTNGDLAQLRSALAPLYPADTLCVARSTTTEAQVKATREDPDLRVSPITGVYGSGDPDNPEGQPGADFEVVVTTPAIKAAALRHQGVASVTPWLAPG